MRGVGLFSSVFLNSDLLFGGGGKTSFVFMVATWFGIRGDSESGSLGLSKVSGQLLTMASASQISV